MTDDNELLPKMYEVDMNKLEKYLKDNSLFITDINKKQKEKFFNDINENSMPVDIKALVKKEPPAGTVVYEQLSLF